MRRLQDAVAARSAELGLPDGVLASRRWLEALLDSRLPDAPAGEDWPGMLAGWRRTQLEPALAPLLASLTDSAFAAPPTPPYRIAASWGGSSAGRASRSQCEGREFDPLPLHQENENGRESGRFCFLGGAEGARFVSTTPAPLRGATP